MNKDKVNDITQPEFDEQDTKIYKALIGLGWLIPQTEEEIEIAEEALKELEIPSLPTELEDSSKILENIRKCNKDENKNNSEDITKTNLRLVSSESESLIQNKQVKDFDENCPTLMSLLRKYTNDMPSKIAQNLEITVAFMRGCSDYSAVVPEKCKQELIDRAYKLYNFISKRLIESVVRTPGLVPTAGFRDTSYSGNQMSFEEIVRKSGLDEESQKFWLKLAQE